MELLTGREDRNVASSHWTFCFNGQLVVVKAVRWYEARRRAAAHFNCGEQDVNTQAISKEAYD